MNPAAHDGLFHRLDAAAAQGALRRLDVAFARFLAESSPGATSLALLAAALVAHLEGDGHSCLPLADVAAGAVALLGPRVAGSGLELGDDGRWPVDPARWRSALAACEAVAVDPGDVSPLRPLVLSGDRLYLRRYWDHERRVARQVAERAARPRTVDADEARGWLDALFPADGNGETSAVAGAAPAMDWQRAACAVALRRHLAVITGGPGTGKTYTAARLLAARFATATAPERLRVALAAPTGKAAARLRQSIEGALQALPVELARRLPMAAMAASLAGATTLHALLGARPGTRRFQRHAGRPLEVDLLVVDEASMIHLEMMSALLEALPAGAQLVLLGDKDQLASVEAGAVLGDLCRGAEDGHYDADTVAWLRATTGRHVPDAWRDPAGGVLSQATVMLRTSRRFGTGIGRLARAVNAGRADEACALLEAGDSGASAPGAASANAGDAASVPAPAVGWRRADDPRAVRLLAVGDSRAPASGGYADYLQVLQRRPTATSPTREELDAWAREVLGAFDRFRVLSAVREGPWGVAGLNQAIEQALAESGGLSPRGEWYEGRPVLVTRNDPSLGVFNGDIGIALRVPVVGADGRATTALRVHFVEGPRVRSVSVGRLADVETAFAMTVHKSQGSEFGHTVLVLGPEAAHTATRELVYTGVTRARDRFTLVSPSMDGLVEAIGRTTRRASGLRAWWDRT